MLTRNVFAAIALLALTQTSYALTVAPLPNLDIWSNGSVFALTEAPDGSIYVGGLFTLLDGEPRANLVRITPDGKLDPAFTPNANNAVYSIKILEDGSLLIAGEFTAVNGVPRNFLARLLADGSLDQDWNPMPNNVVVTIALGSEDDMFIGGQFTQVGGTSRSRIARLNLADGSVVQDWSLAANALVWSLVPKGNGQIWVGGEFDELNGIPIGALALVDIDTLTAEGYSVADTVYAVTPGPTGEFYVCGAFSTILGQDRHSIARLDALGNLDMDWIPVIDGKVYDCLPTAAGVVATGIFAEVEGQSLGGLARFNLVDGGVDASFIPSLGGAFSNMEGSESIGVVVRELTDGNIFVGGTYRYVDDAPASGGAVLDQINGGVVKVVDAERSGTVTEIVQLPDGSWLAGGTFRRAGSHLRDNLMRLDNDGALDADWDIGTSGTVRSILVKDGSAFIGGQFARLGTHVRTSLGKIDFHAEGAVVDEKWAPALSGFQTALVMREDRVRQDHIYVGGLFEKQGPGNYFAQNLLRLSTSGAGEADTSMVNIASNGQINTIAQTNDAVIYLGGAFSRIRSTNRTGLAAFDNTSQLGFRPSFNSELNGLVWAVLADDPTDSIYATGFFTQALGQARIGAFRLQGNQLANWAPSITDGFAIRMNRDSQQTIVLTGNFQRVNNVERRLLARVNSEGVGALDPDFSPVLSGSVLWSTVFSENDLWIGGAFVEVNGVSRRAMARLSTDFEIEDDVFSDRFEIALGESSPREFSIGLTPMGECAADKQNVFTPQALRRVKEPDC